MFESSTPNVLVTQNKRENDYLFNKTEHVYEIFNPNMVIVKRKNPKKPLNLPTLKINSHLK